MFMRYRRGAIGHASSNQTNPNTCGENTGPQETASTDADAEMEERNEDGSGLEMESEDCQQIGDGENTQGRDARNGDNSNGEHDSEDEEEDWEDEDDDCEDEDDDCEDDEDEDEDLGLADSEGSENEEEEDEYDSL